MLAEYERLKEVREYMGMTQVDFAKLLGVKQGYLSDIERGNAEISRNVKKRIESLGVSIDYIENGIGVKVYNRSKSTRERFLELISFLGYDQNINAFANRIDISIIERAEIMGGDKPSKKVLENLLNCFPHVNKEWLLHERGAIFIGRAILTENNNLYEEISRLKETLKEKNEEIMFLRSLLSDRRENL